MLSAVVLAPEGEEWTCTQGQQRVLDFVVLSACLAPLVRLTVDVLSPWSPHRALRLELDFCFDAFWVYQQVKPATIPVAAGPKREWRCYREQAEQQQACFEVAYPFAREATSLGLSSSFYRFALAAEYCLLDVATARAEDVPKHCGRGSPAVFR